MHGIALPYSDLPQSLIEEHRLDRFTYDRGGEREIRFLRKVREPILPVWHCGELKIVSWGCRNGTLPRTGTTWQRTVEAGEWVGAEEVIVPAAAGLQSGIWFPISQGVKAVLATKAGTQAVYLIVEPATYYFRIMTKSQVMPKLVEEQI